jgi:hypothetical protein
MIRGKVGKFWQWSQQASNQVLDLQRRPSPRAEAYLSFAA